MKVVIDTNVFIAALLKDSVVRIVLNFADVDFYMPEKGLEEVKKYSEDLCAKAGYSSLEFEKMISVLLENVELVPKEDMKDYMGEAEKIMENIDLNDSSFIATALAVDTEGIWSFDNDFKKQDKVNFFETEDFLNFEEREDVHS